MFRKSRIIDKLRDFCLGLDKGNCINENASEFLERLFYRLDEVGVNYSLPYTNKRMTSVFYRENIEYIGKLILKSNNIDLIYILYALKDLEVDIKEEDIINNLEIESKYEKIIEKLKLKNYNETIHFLEDSHNTLYSNDYRGCMTHICSTLENIIRTILNENGLFDVNNGIVKNINICVSNNILSKKFENDAKDIANDRVDKGAHGTLIYKTLGFSVVNTYFYNLLKIIDDLIS